MQPNLAADDHSNVEFRRGCGDAEVEPGRRDGLQVLRTGEEGDGLVPWAREVLGTAEEVVA